jgi:hypothetical protein
MLGHLSVQLVDDELSCKPLSILLLLISTTPALLPHPRTHPFTGGAGRRTTTTSSGGATTSGDSAAIAALTENATQIGNVLKRNYADYLVKLQVGLTLKLTRP